MDLIKYFSKYIRSIFGNKILILLAIVLCPLFYRDRIYQSVVTYRIERQRGFAPTLEPSLEKRIAGHHEVHDRHFKTREKIIHVALKVTADFLNFDGEKNDFKDPISIYNAETVNSASFATFFMATAQFLIQKNGLSDRFICQQYIAERRQNGTNLHDRYVSPYGNSPFNAERDIVSVLDLKTGEKRFVDPTIFEQWSIINIKVEGERDPSVWKASAGLSDK
jgi:hypothetical protein